MPTRVFALTQAEAANDPSVVLGEILIHGVPTFALIDSGATHSFASKKYVKRLDIMPCKLSDPYSVMLPSGEIVSSNLAIQNSPVIIDNRELLVNLIVMDMPEYDVILGMDWLSRYNASIDCKRKMVIFKPTDKEEFSFKESTDRSKIFII